MLAAAGSSVAPLVRGPARTARVLGTVRSALYLEVSGDVLAVLAPDAVRLPCSVVLGAPLALTSVRPDGAVSVGGGRLAWVSGGRPVAVQVVREWRPPVIGAVLPCADRLAELRAAVVRQSFGVLDGVVDAAPDALLGRGPGLTPSGDDVLAGWLVAARAFGTPPPGLPSLARTTALSASLLRCAARGECVPQLAAVVRGVGAARPQPEAIEALLAVGHTSGAALAAGVLRASAAVVGRAA